MFCIWLTTGSFSYSRLNGRFLKKRTETSKVIYLWVSEHFLSLSRQEQVTFQWDDDDASFDYPFRRTPTEVSWWWDDDDASFDYPFRRTPTEVSWPMYCNIYLMSHFDLDPDSLLHPLVVAVETKPCVSKYNSWIEKCNNNGQQNSYHQPHV